MNESLFYFLLGLGASVPAGYVTNVLFQKLHKPTARVYLSNPSGWRLWQGKVRRLSRKLAGKEVREVVVCTDGDFIDTAIFFLVVLDAAKSIHNVDIRIRHVEWDNLKHEFGKGANVITYINRRHLSKIDVPVAIWSNLAAFKGYALLGRPPDFPGRISTLAEANERLRVLARIKRLRIITNGADSVDVLNTPLTPLLNTPRVDLEIDPSSNGLERFLRGRGDLFIAGLPQILAAKRAGMIEVISSENHPLMLGIEALVYDESGVPPEVLEHISDSWSKICRKITIDCNYAREKYAEWCKVADNMGIKVCFPEDDFVLATCGTPGKYIRFFTDRDDAAEELIRASELIMDETGALGLTPRNMRKALRALQDIMSGHPSSTSPDGVAANSIVLG